MLIEIVGTTCPDIAGVTVGVQHGSHVLDQQPADGTPKRWLLDARLVNGSEPRGAFVNGRGNARFLYLSWQDSRGVMFRRAKLMLDAVPTDILAAAAVSGLRATVSLAMPDGAPLCAAVRPPQVLWPSLE